MTSTPTLDTVLVVDDDPTILTLVRDCLTDDGYHVATATTLAEAVALLAHDRFGVILADAFFCPPGPELWEGLGRIRAAAGGTPVVIFSAHRPALFDGWREHGFAGLLPKPFDLDDFLTRVGVYVAGAAPSGGGA